MTTLTLNYKKVGEGEPIIIAHGLFGSLDNWQTISRKIAEQGYEVWSIDLRNHGKSPHVEEMSHELMAEDIKNFILDHGLRKVTLVGHSMGGKTAMQLAFLYPKLLKRLITVDIAPKAYSPHHYTYFEAMESLEVGALNSRKEAELELSTRVKNTGVRQFLLKNLVRKESGFRWKFNLPALRTNYESLIGGMGFTQPFMGPALFIAGKKSDYISPKDEGEIKLLFPNSQLVYIEDAGHWVHAEQPQAFLESLLTFMAEIDDHE